MTNLTELEQNADREARHGHRELVKRLEEENRELALQVLASQGQADEALGRVAELEAELQDEKLRHEAALRAQYTIGDAAWNDAIRAALGHAEHATNLSEAADRIRTLLRKGGSDEV